MAAKKQFISKLYEDQEISDLFLVVLKQLSSGRTGKSYLRLTLGDKTGRIETRVWEGAGELAQRFNQGDLVYVTGVVTSYQGVLQIKATYVEVVEDISKVDWADFLPSSERPAGEMFAELSALLATVENPYLKALLDSFTGDGNFKAELMRAPAALSMHHAYIAGLLEHTLGVVRLANVVSGLYPVNRDLLMAGAFLHDMGKTKELEYSANFDYTDEGRLMGHLVIGLLMVKEKAEAIPGFPSELLLHLEHLLLSHHGELEWGSPKRPKTLEALALHMIDNIDAKLSAADRSFKADEKDGPWTAFQRMFDRPLARTPDFGSKEAPQPAKTPAAEKPLEQKEEKASLSGKPSQPLKLELF